MSGPFTESVRYPAPGESGYVHAVGGDGRLTELPDAQLLPDGGRYPRTGGEPGAGPTGGGYGERVSDNTGLVTYSGPVTLIDELGEEQAALVELVAGADPRTPTIDTWHGRIPNGCEPRWLALVTHYTLHLRFPDGREGMALVDRAGRVLGVGSPPFDPPRAAGLSGTVSG